MTVQIARWGNSLAIRLPRPLLDSAKLSEGDEVEVKASGGCLVVRPLRPRRLAEMIAAITPENVHGEAFADTPLGNEVW